VVSSDGHEVSLLPLHQALEERPDASLTMFGTRPPAEP
jgi:hypothetical protein